MDSPLCEACGKRCEVYGSSWCANCDISTPLYLKDRLLKMRNALISISVNSKGLIRRAATQALERFARDAGVLLCQGRATNSQASGSGGTLREMLLEDLATFASVYHAALCCWTFGDPQASGEVNP
jgi:hypothetical protein